MDVAVMTSQPYHRTILAVCRLIACVAFIEIISSCVYWSGCRCATSVRQRPCCHDVHRPVFAPNTGRRPESDQQTGLSGWSQSAAAGGWQVSTHTFTLALRFTLAF